MTRLDISLAEYARGVRAGEISAAEFAAATLERIAEHDGALHAYVSLDSSAAERAAEVDRMVARGEDPGPLAGAPLSVKDNIAIAGRPLTCCSMMLRSYVSPYDATAVARARAAGALIIGQTNMDEFAMGLTTEFSAFGASRNPWNTEYVPGGSSGGSAAAVSALECIASLGSDTGGSVRTPASFCSIVGYKPTYGLVSRYGLVAYSNGIEQIGPMARSVEDVALLLNVISGADEMDDTTRSHSDPSGSAHAAEHDAPGTDYLDGIGAGVEGGRVGIVADAIDESTPPGRAARDAADELARLGAEVIDVDLGMANHYVSAYYMITSAEASSNLARFDNIRYGYGLPKDGYAFDSYVTHARSMMGPEVKRRMILGGFVLSAGYAGKYYGRAMSSRAGLIRTVDEAFASERIECVLSPTVPVPPFRIGEKIDDPAALFDTDEDTVIANLTGRPAVSVPFEMHGGLPIGMQLTGRFARDRDLLRWARALHSVSRAGGAPEL